LCLDQLATPPLGRADAAEQWPQHWQTFVQATAADGLPCLVVWAGPEEGVLPVRQAVQSSHTLTEYAVGALSDEEWQRLLPRLARGVPRAGRSAWERLMAGIDAPLRLPAHALLATTCAVAMAESQQLDAASQHTVTPADATALVQRLVQTVQHRQPAAAAFFQQLLAIIAFLPPGKEFVIDEIFPLCDLEAVALDAVRGRATLAKLLGECVRYGLLEYATYTSRYNTGCSVIQHALQALVCATVHERSAVARWRQLAAAVIYHVQYGEREVLPALAQVTGAEENAGAAALLVVYLAAPLRRILGQSTKAERQYIAEGLGKFPSPLAVDLLMTLLDDEEGQVRSRAVQSLIELEGVDTVAALFKALQDSNSDVRWIAACALGKIDGAATVDALIAMLSDEDKEVGRIAAEGLGQKGDRRAVPHLIAAMRDSYPLLRESAALALGQLADKRALPALQELLQDTNLQVRRSAEAALSRLLPSSS
jgi:HEAT repeats